MNVKTPLILLALCAAFTASATTIDECISLACDNYPLIKKYGVVEQMSSLELSDINKTWLPRINVYAQGTVMNHASKMPETIKPILQQLGLDYKGFSKFTYQGGVGLWQNIWDGGATKAGREAVRAGRDATKAEIDAGIYQVRSHVEDIYFGVLMLEQQVKEVNNTISLLQSTYKEMESMYRNGTAMKADVEMVDAQILTLQQQVTEAQGNIDGLRAMMTVFTGKDMSKEEFATPSAEVPLGNTSNRPELTMFDKKILSNNAKRSSVKSSVFPTVGFFADAYYGYPGFDIINSFKHRKPSFNVIAGIRVNWNIDAFYTKKNRLSELDAANMNIEADRDVFLFNSSLESEQLRNQIKGLDNVIKNDDKIVGLRKNVTHAAESQLREGIIDTNALMTKVTEENQARLSATCHQIERLKLIYKLKNTLNR